MDPFAAPAAAVAWMSFSGNIIKASRGDASPASPLLDIANRTHFGNAGFYDFMWSSGFGSQPRKINVLVEFVLQTCGSVRVGGVAVHVVDLLLDRTDGSGVEGNGLLVSRDTLSLIGKRLRDRGCELLVDRTTDVIPRAVDEPETVPLTVGEAPTNFEVDVEPYSPDTHLKLRGWTANPYVGWATWTSAVLIFRRVRA